MAPKRNNQHPIERRNDNRPNEWVTSREEFFARQEDFQTTMVNSINALTKALRNNQLQRHESDNGSDAGDRQNRERHQHRDAWRERGEDRRWESGFKLDLPEFHGGMRGDELLEWIVVVEEMLEFKRVPEDRQVVLVATKLHGQAASWWLQLKATRSRTGKGKVATWPKLVKYLKQAFLPQNYDLTTYTRLQNLRQGSRTVDEYADEFFLLITQNEIFESEIQMVSRFIGGLRAQIQTALMQFDSTKIAEARRRALAFEQQFKSNHWPSNNYNRGYGGKNVEGGKIGFIEKDKEIEKPSNDSVEIPLVRRSTRPNALRCFTCGENGHIQTACPQKKNRGQIVDHAQWDEEKEF